MKQYRLPILMLAVFEAVAISLWLAKDNVFYLFNFSYIGLAVSLGMLLFIKKHAHDGQFQEAQKRDGMHPVHGVQAELPRERAVNAW